MAIDGAKTDMPTLVISKDDPHNRGAWFAWVDDGLTIGYVHSLPEAVQKANQEGVPCGYLIWSGENGNQQTTLGISSCVGSYQNINKEDR